MRSGGVVGQRVHLNVDYDSKREFEASNNIQVYYQGMEDEILRRVDVGNVTFAVPASRFITAGIPSNNFGIQAQGQLGALDFTGIFAQQKGNVVHGRTFTVGSQTVQTLDRDIADRDFEPLRFFFVVDPESLPGFPELDVLQLSRAGLPASAQVAQVRVYRRRSSLNQAGTAQQNLSGISAVALRPDSPQRAGPFPWEILTEGRDYYLDASGLWIGLAARLDQDDYLAVSYVTAAGDSVGTFPGTATAGRVDTLRLVYEPRRGADLPTFRYEMRNFYRIGAQGDVVRETAGLRIIVGESERPASGAATFLAQLGVAQQTDQTTFDQLNRLFPRTRDPGSGAPLRDYFVVFPSLRPFADSTALPAQFRNDSLYRTPTYLLRTQGPTPLYTLRLHYDARGGDDRRVLSLGGLQIREGSEKITADGRQLVRNVDYSINYEVGQVTFTAPGLALPGPDGGGRPVRGAAGVQHRADLDLRPPGPLRLRRARHADGARVAAAPAHEFHAAPPRVRALLALRRRRGGELPLRPRRAHPRAQPPAVRLDGRPLPDHPRRRAGDLAPFAQPGGRRVRRDLRGGGRALPRPRREPLDVREPARLAPGARGARHRRGARIPGTRTRCRSAWQNIINSPSGQVRFRTSDIDPSVVVQGTGINERAGALVPDAAPRHRGRPPDTTGASIRWHVVPCTPTARAGASITQLPFPRPAWTSPGSEYASSCGSHEDNDRTARTVGGDPLRPRLLRLGVRGRRGTPVPQRFTVSASRGDTVYSGRRRATPGRLQTERDTLTGAWNAQINDNGILGDVADAILNATTGTL